MKPQSPVGDYRWRVLRAVGFLVAMLLAIAGVQSRARAQAKPSASAAVHSSESHPGSATTGLVPDPLPPESFSRNRGYWDFGLQVAYAVENDIPRNISHINLFYGQPQIGFIVHDFHASPVRRFEVLSEGVLGGAVHPGGKLLGYALILRLDGKPRGRWVPFFDAGAGVLNTTINNHASELSGHTQFSPQGGLGVQYFVRPQRALVFEYRYLHMSNNGIEPPNHGFNASMITLGFRWFRRPRP